MPLICGGINPHLIVPLECIPREEYGQLPPLQYVAEGEGSFMFYGWSFIKSKSGLVFCFVFNTRELYQYLIVHFHLSYSFRCSKIWLLIFHLSMIVQEMY